MKNILIITILMFLAACQSAPKHAPKCVGEFTSLNPDFIYDKKKIGLKYKFATTETSSNEVGEQND